MKNAVNYFEGTRFRGLQTIKDIGEKLEVVSPTTAAPTISIDGLQPDNSLDGLLETVMAATEARNNVWPSWFLEKHGAGSGFEDLPAWLGKQVLNELEVNGRNSFVDAASWLVSMDHPFDLCKAISDHYWPKYGSVTRFVEKHEFEAHVGLAVSAALDEVFKHKWAHLTARPVEKLEALGLPQAGLELYKHPAHPAWPAGHGGAAGATYKACSSLLGLTGTDLEDVRVGCLAFAMFRSFSFMHVASENWAGFVLGDRVAGFRVAGGC